MNKLVLLVATITAIVIVACSGDSQESNDVVVTLDWFQNANHVGVYEAVSKGYFGEENLNVTIQPPADPAAILGLVANGESDFAFYYQPDLLH